MGLHVLRNTIVAADAPAGADQVIGWAPMSEGAVLHSVRGEIHILGPEEQPVRQVRGYGLSGELVPFWDIDSSVTLDVLWDQSVTKTVDASQTVAGTSIIDADPDTADTDPDVEPGTMDINAMTGILEGNKKIITPRMVWTSSAKDGIGGFNHEEAATDTFMPRSFMSIESSRKLIMDEGPGFAMLAFSSPTFDQEETGHSTPATATQWAVLSYLRKAMEDFWRVNVGLTEAGAETPYADIGSQIENLVAPEIVQPATAHIDSTAWRVFCALEWHLEFPDDTLPTPLQAHAGRI